MKKLAITCLSLAAVSIISACAIFDDDDDHPAAHTMTTTTEETHSYHAATAPSVGVTTQQTTQSVQPAY